MSGIVTEARTILVDVPSWSNRVIASADLVRGLLAEVDRLLAVIAEAREACPAVRMERYSDASLLLLINEEVSQLFRMQSRAEQAEAEVERLRGTEPARRAALCRICWQPVDRCVHAAEPRCTCTHRRSEHYGQCQRPGCGCRAYQEPERQ